MTPFVKMESYRLIRLSKPSQGKPLIEFFCLRRAKSCLTGKINRILLKIKKYFEL